MTRTVIAFCLMLAICQPSQASIKSKTATAAKVCAYPAVAAGRVCKWAGMKTYHGMCAVGKWNEESHFGSFCSLIGNMGMIKVGFTNLPVTIKQKP